MKVSNEGKNYSRALNRMRKDPMMKQLMKAQPEDIIDWWNNTATNAQKDDLMLRMVITLTWLVKQVDFE